MKVSVSLDEADVAFLDADVERGVYPSRSAAVGASIKLLRERELSQSYFEEFETWAVAGDSDAWESTSGDGLPNS